MPDRQRAIPRKGSPDIDVTSGVRREGGGPTIKSLKRKVSISRPIPIEPYQSRCRLPIELGKISERIDVAALIASADQMTHHIVEPIRKRLGDRPIRMQTNQ